MSAIASVLAVIVTVIIAYRNRRKKSFSYEILSENQLISVGDEIKGKLKLLYEDNPIENATLLLVRFTNSGNVPITASDYERPLTLRFKGRTVILSTEYVKANPDNLKVELNVGDNIITVTPVLMNGGDSFTVKVLLGQYASTFDVDARIVGVNALRAIRRSPQTEYSFREILITPASMAIVTTVFIALMITSITWLYTIQDSRNQRIGLEPNRLSSAEPAASRGQGIIVKDIIVTEITSGKAGVRVALKALAEGEGLTYKWDAINGEISGDQSGYATFRHSSNGGVGMVILTVIDRNGVRDYRVLRLPGLTESGRPANRNQVGK